MRASRSARSWCSDLAGQTALLAVLIDADNVSPKHAEAIFKEIATFGEASVRRIYGDFSDPHLKGWAGILASFAIVPHQQFANTVGKNSSDIALVIDAMDLLHSGRFDGFVLVSSDSDFTRLASRIREQGLDVFGIGQRKTPDAFRNACKRFIFIENIVVDADSGEQGEQGPSAIDALPLIMEALEAIESEDEWYPLDRVGQQLVANKPDFDPRSFGASKLSALLEQMQEFEVDRKSRPLRIRPHPAKLNRPTFRRRKP
ncbi:MAG: NYN domain-containing protein [Nitratireductor sp.]|nr:NYN domain-containing protein [Nitratireductor sp.]